jgi:hypothetical protein
VREAGAGGHVIRMTRYATENSSVGNQVPIGDLAIGFVRLIQPFSRASVALCLSASSAAEERIDSEAVIDGGGALREGIYAQHHPCGLLRTKL